MTFEQYAIRRLPVLLGTARALCGDPGLAEDLVHDVLIKLHARWSEIDSVDSLDAYVRRMLINELSSWRRKWARLVPHADPSQGASDPADYATEYSEREALLHEIRRLTTRQRIVIVLRYYSDLSDAQIAKTLGCAESTVRVHAARALATLRVTHVEPVEKEFESP